MKSTTIAPHLALRRLQSLCSRSEQCESELMTKLLRWKINREIAERIIARLREDRYVDNVRYAHAYVREKYLFQRWGRKKITIALYAKRINSSVISEALNNEIDMEVYVGNLRDLLRAKARTMEEPRSRENRARLINFATGRGFETALIIKLLDSEELWEQEEE